MRGGPLGLGERQHHAPLDEVLLLLHAGDLGPQVVGQEAAAEVVEEARGRSVQRLGLLEVGDGRLPGVPGVEEALAEHVLLGQDVRDAADARGDEPSLEFDEQGAGQAPAAPAGGDGDAHDPGPFAGDAGECRADGDALVDGDHTGLAVGQRADALGEREDGLLSEFGRGVDQMDHRCEIALAVVVDEPVHRVPPLVRAPAARLGAGGPDDHAPWCTTPGPETVRGVHRLVLSADAPHRGSAHVHAFRHIRPI